MVNIEKICRIDDILEKYKIEEEDPFDALICHEPRNFEDFRYIYLHPDSKLHVSNICSSNIRGKISSKKFLLEIESSGSLAVDTIIGKSLDYMLAKIDLFSKNIAL